MGTDDIQVKKFVEIGFGNRWFVRTEMEHPDGTEDECRGIARPFAVESVYVRLWIGYKVFIWDSKEGMKRTTKGKKRLKCIIGFSGQ